MEKFSLDVNNPGNERIGDYGRSCLDEKRDTSPGRPGKKKLEALLNGHLKIKMTDGRVLIGTFLCTDRDANVILGSCSEYLREEDCSAEEPRILGLVMVPGEFFKKINIECHQRNNVYESENNLGPKPKPWDLQKARL